MRRRVLVAALLGGFLLLSAGCMGNIQVGAPPGEPDCAGPDGRVNDAVVLVAQSVPSAQWLPCLGELPVGWNFQRLEAQSGRTRVLLVTGDRDGEHEVTVTLAATCDIAGAGEVPSDRPGIRRYDRVATADHGYLADRYYVFSGGCVTHHFDLRGRAGAQATAAISAGLGFVSRSAAADAIRERSHGRLTLDPPGHDTGGQR
jgi:hypothetical protein